MRGWVKWGELGIKPPNPEGESDAQKRMAEAAVVLTPAQRCLVEQTIADHCRIRGWELHAVRALTNHVHVVVSADRDPNEVMNQFKVLVLPQTIGRGGFWSGWWRRKPAAATGSPKAATRSRSTTQSIWPTPSLTSWKSSEARTRTSEHAAPASVLCPPTSEHAAPASVNQ